METDNIQTIITESRRPILIDNGIKNLTQDGCKPLAYIPEGYAAQDLEKFLDAPLRKRAAASLLDTESFVKYLKKHGIADQTVIYAETDFEKQYAKLACILDDHGTLEDQTSWRTHTATFQPTQTVEWKRWNGCNNKAMSQADFAVFLEENMPDIASGIEGMPTGTEMLQMAVGFEATAEKRFKQKLNIQSGGTTLEYVNTDSAETVERMKVFDRFSLGLKVFIGGAAYRVDARLKYRQNGDKLNFFYQLIRADRVFESAIKDEIAKVAEETGFLILTGKTSD